MAIPPDQLAVATDALTAFCAQVPERVRHLVEHTFRVEAQAIVLVSRHRRSGKDSEWMDEDVAKFRFFKSREEWDLYWSDRNSRWRLYEWVRPAKRFATLLKEVERDPTHLFWG